MLLFFILLVLNLFYIGDPMVYFKENYYNFLGGGGVGEEGPFANSYGNL